MIGFPGGGGGLSAERTAFGGALGQNWKVLDLFKDPEVEMELKDAGAEVPWLGDQTMPEARIEFVFYAKNMESCLNVF